MNLKLSYAGKTDVGLVRSGNEDAFKIVSDYNLYIVCDGMGGHQAGEVASRDACETIEYCFTEMAADIAANDILRLERDLPPTADLLVRAIRIANRGIYMRSRSNSALTGMGTTIVAAVFENDFIHVAHVGDSRAYLLKNGELIRLTADHSWVSEMQTAGQISEEKAAELVARNVITRALGVNEKTEIDIRSKRVEAGDIYILCTDGLCGYADDEEILSAANQCKGDVDKIVSNLVKLANEHGGQDNVTAVAIKVEAVEGKSDGQSMEPVTLPKENDEALMAENEIINSIVQVREQMQQQEVTAEVEQKSSKFPLAFIFFVFIIIAALIIYFNLGR